MGGGGGRRPWRRLMDVTAILLLVAVVTGLVLWLRLPRRRLIGTLSLLAQPSHFEASNPAGGVEKAVFHAKVFTTKSLRHGVRLASCSARIRGGGWAGSVRPSLSSTICCSASGSV